MGLRLNTPIECPILGFGPGVVGNYKGSLIQAKPTEISQLRGGFPGIGQLNSEMVFVYLLSPNWLLKAGYSHFFSEYKTGVLLDDGNDRFRHIADTIVLGAIYQY